MVVLYEHDVVELTEPCGRLPAGTRGTLVSEPREGVASLEPAGATGLDDLVDVPLAKLRPA